MGHSAGGRVLGPEFKFLSTWNKTSRGVSVTGTPWGPRAPRDYRVSEEPRGCALSPFCFRLTVTSKAVEFSRTVTLTVDGRTRQRPHSSRLFCHGDSPVEELGGRERGPVATRPSRHPD